MKFRSKFIGLHERLLFELSLQKAIELLRNKLEKLIAKSKGANLKLLNKVEIC